MFYCNIIIEPTHKIMVILSLSRKEAYAQTPEPLLLEYTKYGCR